MVRTLVASILFLGCLFVSLAEADNWPQFRGPQANGLSADDQLPMEWGADKAIHWQVKIPGQGWSAPIIWNNRVFVTTAVSKDGKKPEYQQRGAGRGDRPQRGNRPPKGEARPNRNREGNAQRGQRQGRNRQRRNRKPPESVYRWEVYCFDLATGDEIWKKVARESRPTMPIHRSNTYASETPVTDGEHIYAYFGMAGVYCYDLDGELKWEKDLGVYPMQAGWGTSSSPVLNGGLVFLQIDNESDSFIVALDKKTGEEKWREKRDERSNWATPFIWKNKDRTEVIAAGRVIRSYDPETGKQLWQLDNHGGRSSATPTADENVLYIGTEERNRGGYDDGGGVLFAIKAGANGDITPPAESSTSEGVIWSVPKSGLSMASPVICQGYIYILDRRSGLVACRDAKDGSLKYRKRVPGARAFWSSPWAVGDEVYCLDDRGTTHVLQAGPDFKILAKNTIDEQFWATSAMADGSLLLRGAEQLYCIRKQ